MITRTYWEKMMKMIKMKRTKLKKTMNDKNINL